jgi:hypothetical protein
MKKRTLFLATYLLLLAYSFDRSTRHTTGEAANSLQSNSSTAQGQPRLVIDARNGYLMGASNGKVWLEEAKAMPLVKDGEACRLYQLTGQLGTCVIGKAAMEEYPCDELVKTAVTPLPEVEEGIDDNIVAVNGTWNAQPRLPKIQSTDQQEYRDVVSNFVKRLGVTKPEVTIHQLLRVDLDGDGTEEVLISANSRKEPSMFMSRGDFKVVLMRKVVRGQAQTIPITSEVETKNHRDPIMTGKWHQKETVIALLDINGDGVMEVITTFASFRDNGKSVYEVKGAKPKGVLGWYCSGGH